MLSSLLLASMAVLLLWVPAGIFLFGYYQIKYEPPEAKHYLDYDMKKWAPWVALILGIILSKTMLLGLCTCGALLDTYFIYGGSSGAVDKFNRYL